MKYCPRCGVILAEDAVRCILCGSLPVNERPPAADAGASAAPSDSAPGFKVRGSGQEAVPDILSASERRYVAAELLSVAFGIALLVSVLADLFANHAFTWSRYSSIAIVVAWLVSAMPLLLYGRPWILFAALAPSLVLLVFLLDALDGRISWFLGYGLPITLSFVGVAAGTGALIGSLKPKGLNALAVFLGGIAAVCIAVEATVDLNRFRALLLDWSVVVAFALVPTAGLLFYLHYRIMNRASLRKLFRL